MAWVRGWPRTASTDCPPSSGRPSMDSRPSMDGLGPRLAPNKSLENSPPSPSQSKLEEQRAAAIRTLNKGHRKYTTKGYCHGEKVQ